MSRRSLALLMVLSGAALVASCSNAVPTSLSSLSGTSTTVAVSPSVRTVSVTSVGREATCVSTAEAATVVNASHLRKLAAAGQDPGSYPYAYTAESTTVLACDAGLAVVDAGLRDRSGEPVPTELYRYLISQSSSGDWYDATSEYTVIKGDRFVGMNCDAMPRTVAEHYTTVAPGEMVTYPSRACAQATNSSEPTSAVPTTTTAGGEHNGPCDPHTISGDLAELRFEGTTVVGYCDGSWAQVQLGDRGDTSWVINRSEGTWNTYMNLSERRCVSTARVDKVPSALDAYFDATC